MARKDILVEDGKLILALVEAVSFVRDSYLYSKDILDGGHAWKMGPPSSAEYWRGRRDGLEEALEQLDEVGREMGKYFGIYFGYVGGSVNKGRIRFLCKYGPTWAARKALAEEVENEPTE